MRRRNSISGQFAARLIEMLESPAYRVLSRSAHLVISRVEVELAHHGGNDNDILPVTLQDFIAYGVERSSVAPAIREAAALGFIRVQRGRGGNAEHRTPSLYGLTFGGHRERHRSPLTDDWRKIQTIEEAEQIARAARQAKDQRAVQHGKRNWQKRQQKKQNTGTGKPYRNRYWKTDELVEVPVLETSTTGVVGKTVPLSISRGVAARAQPRRQGKSKSHACTANGSGRPAVALKAEAGAAVAMKKRDGAAAGFVRLSDVPEQENGGGRKRVRP
jgi:hypothetical protein